MKNAGVGNIVHYGVNVTLSKKKQTEQSKSIVERLNPNSILICNLALRECGKEVKNNPTALMEHFVNEHGWKKIPEYVQRDINEKRPHPHTKRLMTKQSYLKMLETEPEQWWFDNEFIWRDIRNLHFLHKTRKGNRSLRHYYHA